MFTGISNESYRMMRLITKDVRFMDIKDMMYFHTIEMDNQVKFTQGENDLDNARMVEIRDIFTDVKIVHSHYMDMDTSYYYVVSYEEYEAFFLNEKSMFYIINNRFKDVYEKISSNIKTYIPALERVHELLFYFLIRTLLLRARKIRLTPDISERLGLILTRVLDILEAEGDDYGVKDIVDLEIDSLLSKYDVIGG